MNRVAKFSPYLIMAALQLGLSSPVFAQGRAESSGFFPQLFDKSKPEAAPEESTEAAAPVDPLATSTTAKRAKPAPKPKKRLVNVPLPPPRPWGDRDAFSEPDNVAVAKPDLVEKPAGEVKVAMPVRPPETPPAPARSTGSPGQSVIVIVRDNVHNASDLKGRRIALGAVAEPPADVARIVRTSAGVDVDPVQMDWASGLRGLASGEVDGVLLSLGPSMSRSELEGVTIAGYLLLEIPVQQD